MSAGPAPSEELHDRRWRILAILSMVQFMLFLDDTIVNVALPTIRDDLGFSQTGLAWVVNAYVVVFGGLLLLGGRLADLLGRRRMYLIGVTIFAGASILNALAQDPGVLIGSRAVQGLGAALTAPASLSMVAVLFSVPEERAKAFALLSSLGGAGAAAGVVLSGVITELIDWRVIFYINVPIAVVAIAFVATVVRLPEQRRGGSLDVLGATVVTAALVLLIYTLLEVHNRGWLSALTLGGFAVTAALMWLFVVVERSTSSPLVRFDFFRHRRRTTALALHNVVAAGVFGVFFLLTLYMQRLLDYSPVQGGLAWLGLFAGVALGFGTAPWLARRVGVRPVMVGGFTIGAAGILWFTGISVRADYFTDLLPGMALAGFGAGWTYMSITIAAVFDVEERDAGLAAGLLNTGQQVGGALGLAVLVALAADRAEALIADGSLPAAAQVSANHLAFAVGAGLYLAAAVIALMFIGSLKPRELPQVPVPVASDQPTR